MRLIEQSIIEDLFKSAEDSERKRSHFLLHSSHDEKVQRLLIALVDNSYVEPHFHELEHQWEMFVVLEGTLDVCLYDNSGNIINQFSAGEGTGKSIIEFHSGDIHSVRCTSPRALMLEIKEGPFLAQYAKKSPDWLS